MKKEPKDGGYYQKSVKPLKAAVNKIARAAEKTNGLPQGSVKVSITKLSDATRDRLINGAAKTAKPVKTAKPAKTAKASKPAPKAAKTASAS